MDLITKDDFKKAIISQLGSEEGSRLYKEIEPNIDTFNTRLPTPLQLFEASGSEPNQTGKTRGDWNASLPHNKWDLRPPDFLGYAEINAMLNSGIIRFAVDMKRSQMHSVFRSDRIIKVVSPDKELQKLTEAWYPTVIPQMAFEFIWSSLVYGSTFMEKVFEKKTAFELGFSKGRTNKFFDVPKIPNLVPHETIKQINRTANGRFDGFIQSPMLRVTNNYYPGQTHPINTTDQPTDIEVSVRDSLIIPYNGFSRNLWGESFLKPLYPLWYWYSIIMKSMVQYSQLMGDPPKFAKAPERKKLPMKDGSLVDAIDWMLAITANLQHTNVVVYPSDVDPETKVPLYDVGYITMPDRSQPFINILEGISQQILRAALTADRATTQNTGQTGSYNLGELHQEATALNNQMIVTSWLHYINRFLVSDISLYNRGLNGPPIRLETQGLDQRERQFLNNMLGIAGNFKSVEDFYYDVDWKSLANLAGVPVLSDEDKQKRKEELKQESLANQKEQMEMAKEFGGSDKLNSIPEKKVTVLDRKPNVETK